MSETPAITQNEAVEYANVTRAKVIIGEHSSVPDGHANLIGRIRAPDIIDPYQMSQARRKHPGWRTNGPAEPDRDG